MADHHIQKFDTQTQIHIVTRAGNEFSIDADEIISPRHENGLLRFKLSGEVVCLVLASQFAAWRI